MIFATLLVFLQIYCVSLLDQSSKPECHGNVKMAVNHVSDDVLSLQHDGGVIEHVEGGHVDAVRIHKWVSHDFPYV